ncbi:Protein of unknown function [Sulfobacillus thermosulfidooxidans DSM 9293]|uniref:DUF1116 domain-containing protein n=2 Tax=Sulfobacillus thermosulfidooxidans TaxID=28034 RepID=A0A1W1WBJ6_SULTA|nr:Protein of unknown function [Sulfobacillus thermosulfidooxidans DSM 9293]
MRVIKSQDLSPRLVGVIQAKDVVSYESPWLLHPGPPLSRALDTLYPAQRKTLKALALWEHWSDDDKELKQSLRLFPTQDFHIAAPLVGWVSPSMLLWVVEDPITHFKGYAPINEGTGPSLRMGEVSKAILDRQEWLNQVFAPVMTELLHVLDIQLWPIIQQALYMGDELHMRSVAASFVFQNLLMRPLLTSGRFGALSLTDQMMFFQVLWGNPLAFLNIVMAMSQIYFQYWAEQKFPANMITAIGANGFAWGYRCHDDPAHWQLVPAPLAVPGRQVARSFLPIIGDSFVCEVMGFGGQIIHNAPGLWQDIGYVPPLSPSEFGRSALCAQNLPVVLAGEEMPLRGGACPSDLPHMAFDTACVGIEGGFLGAGRVDGSSWYRSKRDECYG